MEKLRLGKINGAAGLKGELRVYPYTDYKEKFEEIEYVLLAGVKHPIERVRYMKNMAILKLAGIDDRNEAEKYKEQELYIYQKDAPPLEEGAYYVKDLIGLRVSDETGREIGRLVSVMQNSAQDLYEVELPEGRRFFVPAVEEFILNIDLDAGEVRIHLIEGLMDL